MATVNSIHGELLALAKDSKMKSTILSLHDRQIAFEVVPAIDVAENPLVTS